MLFPVLVALLGGSSVFDAETTFRGLDRGYSEVNPLMRPVVEAGRVPTYLTLGGLGALTSIASNELRKRGTPVWWVPLVAGTLGHTVAGLLNQRKP